MGEHLDTNDDDDGIVTLNDRSLQFAEQESYADDQDGDPRDTLDVYVYTDRGLRTDRAYKPEGSEFAATSWESAS